MVFRKLLHVSRSAWGSFPGTYTEATRTDRSGKPNNCCRHIWRVYGHLFCFDVLVNPKHASDGPPAISPRRWDHLGPLVMSHRGRQEPALDPPRLRLLNS